MSEGRERSMTCLHEMIDGSRRCMRCGHAMPEPIEAAPITDDQLDRWREVASAATDATWLHGTTEEAGPGALQYMVDAFNRGDTAARVALVHFPAPDAPEGESIVVAITGNGPNGMANARHIAYASPHNVRLIIDELRRTRAELATARANTEARR